MASKPLCTTQQWGDPSNDGAEPEQVSKYLFRWNVLEQDSLSPTPLWPFCRSSLCVLTSVWKEEMIRYSIASSTNKNAALQTIGACRAGCIISVQIQHSTIKTSRSFRLGLRTCTHLNMWKWEAWCSCCREVVWFSIDVTPAASLQTASEFHTSYY